METEKIKDLILPKAHFTPFILKFTEDFIDHHGLSPCVVNWEVNGIHLVFSKFIDLMARSMGDEKRKEILKELDEYKMSLPAFFRD